MERKDFYTKKLNRQIKLKELTEILHQIGKSVFNDLRVHS